MVDLGAAFDVDPASVLVPLPGPVPGVAFAADGVFPVVAAPAIVAPVAVVFAEAAVVEAPAVFAVPFVFTVAEVGEVGTGIEAAGAVVTGTDATIEEPVELTAAELPIAGPDPGTDAPESAALEAGAEENCRDARDGWDANTPVSAADAAGELVGPPWPDAEPAARRAIRNTNPTRTATASTMALTRRSQ